MSDSLLPVPMKSDNPGSLLTLRCIVVATTRMISVIVNKAFAKSLRRAASLVIQNLSKKLNGIVCAIKYLSNRAYKAPSP